MRSAFILAYAHILDVRAFKRSGGERLLHDLMRRTTEFGAHGGFALAIPDNRQKNHFNGCPRTAQYTPHVL